MDQRMAGLRTIAARLLGCRSLRPGASLDRRRHVLADLSGAVEVLFDRYGVPHIYAASEPDLFRAQGYVVARDRLWQLELFRRISRGTLAEVAGPRLLDTDRFFRRLGFARLAASENPAEDGLIPLDSYAAGVNAWLASRSFRPPVEFRLLGIEPRPWSVADLLATAKLYAWLLSSNWQTEYIRGLLIQDLGWETAARLEPAYPRDHPTSAETDAADFALAQFSLAEFGEAARCLEPHGLTPNPATPGAASNAWAASGRHTATGRPLFATDPHLQPQIPSFWYEVHLEAPGFSVAGATVAGAPGVVIGHNRHIAWGITVSFADTQDLYVERLHPTDPGLYEFAGEWAPLVARREAFAVRGRGGLTFDMLYESHHGPIITSLLPPAHSERRAISLCCASREPAKPAAILQLNRARDWGSFSTALGNWTTAALNFVYADVDGNIGYRLAGRVPVRNVGSGVAPAPGWTGRHEWVGYVPPTDLPALLNPESGYVVSANNRIAGDSYRHFLGAEWSNGYRARRIHELLRQTPRHDVASFAAMQADTVSLAAADIVDLLATVRPRDALESRALGLLREWDRRIDAESPAAAIYEVWRDEMLRAVFGARAGHLCDYCLGRGIDGILRSQSYHSRATARLVELLRERPTDWFDSPRTFDGVLHETLRAALDALCQRLGPDPARWRWGGLHQITFSHPLGVGVLGRLVNRGGFAVAGDAETIAQSASEVGPSFAATGSSASYRLIVDLADFDRSIAVLATGQSGVVGSRHYADQLPLWRRHRYHPLPFSRSAVVQSSTHRLVLLPADPAHGSNPAHGSSAASRSDQSSPTRAAETARPAASS